MSKNETLTKVNDWMIETVFLIGQYPFVTMYFTLMVGFFMFVAIPHQIRSTTKQDRRVAVRKKKPKKRPRNPARPPVRGW